MGSKRRTVQNLRIVSVDAEKNLILVRGAIPGANGDTVVVRSAIKGQKAAA
jgi:large subunit ribosomal protein L3